MIESRLELVPWNTSLSLLGIPLDRKKDLQLLKRPLSSSFSIYLILLMTAVDARLNKLVLWRYPRGPPTEITAIGPPALLTTIVGCTPVEGPAIPGGDTLEDTAAAWAPVGWALPWGGDTLKDAAAAWALASWVGVALFERSIILRKVPSAARNRMWRGLEKSRLCTGFKIKILAWPWSSSGRMLSFLKMFISFSMLSILSHLALHSKG